MYSPPIPREMRVVAVASIHAELSVQVLRGQCWVVDGDTIIIEKTHIRLAGIDAPELDHPYGKQSKWALVELCRNQTITAHIKPEMSYDRVVAQCFLPDGRDLGAEMVRMGLAIDWPKFSGGRYQHLEPEGVRKKLWRAALRQRGMATLLDDLQPLLRQPVGTVSERARPITTSPVRYYPPKPRLRPWQVWAAALSLLLLPVGCALTGHADHSPLPVARQQHVPPPVTSQQFAPPPAFVVTALALNVRTGPSNKAKVIAQLERGTVVVQTGVSGGWYAILLQDGRTGWVHSSYLRPADIR